MDKIKKTFKKIFKKKVKPRTLGHIGSPSRKEKDWNILVLTALLLMIASSLWSLYLFLEVNSGSIFREDISIEEFETFNRRDLENSVKEINEIRGRFDSLRVN